MFVFGTASEETIRPDQVILKKVTENPNQVVFLHVGHHVQNGSLQQVSDIVKTLVCLSFDNIPVHANQEN